MGEKNPLQHQSVGAGEQATVSPPDRWVSRPSPGPALPANSQSPRVRQSMRFHGACAYADPALRRTAYPANLPTQTSHATRHSRLPSSTQPQVRFPLAASRNPTRPLIPCQRQPCARVWFSRWPAEANCATEKCGARSTREDGARKLYANVLCVNAQMARNLEMRHATMTIPKSARKRKVKAPGESRGNLRREKQRGIRLIQKTGETVNFNSLECHRPS